MKSLDSIETAFTNHLNELKKAETIQQLIDCNMHNGKPIYSQKFFNKKFKGNIKKAKQYLIREAHIDYDNVIEAMCFESMYFED